MEKKSGSLILVPVGLGLEASHVISNYVVERIADVPCFLVENLKTARRYLRRMGFKGDFDQLEFFLMGKHAEPDELARALKSCQEGKDLAVLSEAGMPGIADPGAMAVAAAHALGVRVEPLVGPSSIFLALAASGFNGQSFCFHGYLPIDKREKIKKLKQLEGAAKTGQAQIFMETPFRNRAMLETICETLHDNSLLCVAADITLPSEFIRTNTIKSWKVSKEDLHKRPAIFILGN